jgi:hypothetical protein
MNPVRSTGAGGSQHATKTCRYAFRPKPWTYAHRPPAVNGPGNAPAAKQRIRSVGSLVRGLFVIRVVKPTVRYRGEGAERNILKTHDEGLVMGGGLENEAETALYKDCTKPSDFTYIFVLCSAPQ